MVDPYEQQLLAVFESCDVKGTGKLDCDGLTQLCDQLHLEDGRFHLMDNLLPEFTFDQFRDALLTLLGATRRLPNIEREPSPDREVSPKFVFGQKKYGRRSRPENTDQEGNDAEDDDYSSGNINDEDVGLCGSFVLQSPNDDCSSKVFSKLDLNKEDRISCEEFLQLCQKTHSTDLAHLNKPSSVLQHVINLDVPSSGYVSSESLVDIWEAGGVVNASGLLFDLGFKSSSEVHVPSLVAVLDEEIRTITNKSVNTSPQVNTLIASLSLAQTQLKWTKSCLEQMTGERDKLHSDLLEANQRAVLLAQEVDDRHAQMERASLIQIKLLEQKHSEQLKQLTIKLAMDKDQLTAATLRLEKKLALQQEEEAKLLMDLHNLQTHHERMEKENHNLSEQLAAGEVVKNKSEKDSLKIQQLQKRVLELESSNDQVQPLVDQLAKLQAENSSLRDRNDELTIQVENLTNRPMFRRQNSLSSLEGNSGGGTKRRGKSPLSHCSEHLWGEEKPRLGKMRRYCTDTDIFLDNVHIKGLAIGRPLQHNESGFEADTCTSLGKLAVLPLSSADKTSNRRITSLTESKMKTVEEERLKNSTYLYSTTNDKETITEVHSPLQSVPDINHLQRHCHELRHALNSVQAEIVKTLTESKLCTEENSSLKKKIEDLNNRLLTYIHDFTQSSSGPYTMTDIPNTPTELNKQEPCVRECYEGSSDIITLTCFPVTNFKNNSSNSPRHSFPNTYNQDDKFDHLSQYAFEITQSFSDSHFANHSLPGLESKPYNNGNSNTSLNHELDVNDENLDDSFISNIEIKTMVQERTKEMVQLEDKCAELEMSLELMRVEYEKCEDYWQSKLREERAIFDQEQKLSDEKFTELEAMIQEYTDLFGSDDKKINGCLPTIDERDSLEKQVTDLEREFEEFRRTAQKELHFKNELIEKLQQNLKEIHKKQDYKIQDLHDVGVQASQDSIKSGFQPLRTNLHTKMYVPLIKVSKAKENEECGCPCHSWSLKSVIQMRDSRLKLQVECDMLHRRREILLHQLTHIHHRSKLTQTPLPGCRFATDFEMLHNISSRLHHQELQCRHLQSSLKHHHRQTSKLLHSSWEQHRADLNSLQKTLHTTQERLLQQSKLCKDQMKKLAASDTLVKDLYKENAYLVALVQSLEEKLVC